MSGGKQRRSAGEEPPESSVAVAMVLVLLRQREIPMSVRLGAADAEAAYARLVAVRHNDDVLRLEGMPPMFHFTETDGNGLVYLEEPASDDG